MFKSSRKQIIVFLIASSLLYLLLFIIEPWRKVLGDTHITLENANLFLLTVFVLFVNFLIYLVICQYTNFSKVSFKKVFIYYTCFSAVLLFVWPVASSDLFSYIYQGRVLSIYQMNPYIYSYSQFGGDNFYNLISNHWSTNISPYGPLFVIVSGIVTWLGQSNLLFSIFLFKVLFVGAHLLTCYLVYKVSDLKTFFIYAFNPLIIFEFIINGHNDVLVALVLVLSFYFLQRSLVLKNQLLAWLFLIISSLIKFTTVVLWPILFIFLLKENLKNKNGVNFVIKTIGLGIVLIGVSFLPFIKNLNIDLLYSNFIKATGVYSLGVWLLMAVLPSFFQANFLNISLLINKIVFIVFYLVSLFRIIVSKDGNYQNIFYKYSTYVLLLFFLTSFTWFVPWYLSVLITFSVLSWSIYKKQTYLIITYAFTFYGIIYYIVLR